MMERPKPLKAFLPKRAQPRKVLQSGEFPDEITPEMVASITKASDWDCDGISDFYDKCLDVPSKNNRDRDRDGWGDPCDSKSSDVSIRFVSNRRIIKRSKTVSIVLLIRNNGPTYDSGMLEISALFPRSIHVISMSPRTPECDESDGGLICEVGDLAVGESMRISVRARAVKNGRGLITAKVVNGMGDLRRGDNIASFRLTIVP